MQHDITTLSNIDPSVNSFTQFSTPRLLTVRQMAERHVCFSQAALRGLIFNSKNRQSSAGEITGNGLNVALVRVGRKLLINEQKFYQWLENQSNG